MEAHTEGHSTKEISVESIFKGDGHGIEGKNNRPR